MNVIYSYKGLKNGMPYGVSEGEVLKVPTLDDSRWVYELEVQKTVTCGIFYRLENAAF